MLTSRDNVKADVFITTHLSCMFGLESDVLKPKHQNTKGPK